MDRMFEELIWHRKENNNNYSNDTVIIKTRGKCVNVEAETLSYIRASLPLKRSNCERLDISK